MKELLRIIQTIRAALQDGAVTPSVEKAAQDYARACALVEQRLETVAQMLQKGSDYQALQAAEQEPPLLDTAAALSFGEEKAWREFCEAHELPVAAQIHAPTVHALEVLYTKGITANHPLYKDFRSAVLSRDDAKSLHIIRTILKLNPADENAKSEFQRLQHKHYQTTLEKLRATLKTDDEETIARLIEELSSLAPDEKLQREEAFVQGQSIRRSWRTRQAAERLPGLISQFQEPHGKDDWRAVGSLLEEITGLITEFSIEPTDEDQKRTLAEITRYHGQRLAADEQQRNFQKSLRSFIAFVEEVETRLLTGAGLTYAELEEKDESFVRQWKELEGHRLPVPNNALQRITRAGQDLRSRLLGMQRARRIRTLMATAAAVFVMLGLASVAFHAWKAHSLSEELAAYREKQTSQPAEELIRQLREKDPLLLRWPFLQSRLEEVDAWASQSRGLERQVITALDDLESSFKNGVSRLPAPALMRGLEDASTIIQQLPQDLAAEPKNRLATLRTRADLHLTDLAKLQSGESAATLAKLESQASEILSFESSAAQATAKVKTFEESLAKLEVGLKPEVESLRLPTDIESRLLALRQRLTAFKTALDSFSKARTQAVDADSLTAYTRALAAWQDISFTEAAPASVVLDARLDEKAILAALISGGDVNVLNAILEDVSSVHMAPSDPMERDLRLLLELRDDEFLNNIWENNVTDLSTRSSQKTYWSQGKLDEAVVGEARRWSGLCFDPSSAASSVTFTQKDFRRVVFGPGNFGGQGVVSSKLSTTSELMNTLQLSRMTDPEGERFLRPLLEIFEQIIDDKDANPITKAYLMLRLEDMASTRPLAWGFHFSPTLQADLAELHRVLGDTRLRSEDWLLQSVRTRFTSPLNAYFEKTTGRSYMKEAKARREMLTAVARSGLKFGGYVETDLTLRLKIPARAASELWVLSKAGLKPLLVANPQSSLPPANPLKAKEAQPLSPVFFISIDRASLMERFESALSASGSNHTPAAGESLFLAPSQP
ncbi:hypothetical protein EI77_01136 [Prosthecobacter fusiformis]|uniref:Uncharacterized protein n=1 Tax=Prosthecobacter fusiformis TaxID=48464 RepID=A0A4R7STJ4_9BACT|nr:hypothetical protein [Prosthecobacter fusiformis]TDU81826.1 hypothetical protein EI77_01136 [Prosthecobacter fusiformis]